MLVKKLAYLLRTGHWPRSFRYPNGIPRVVSPEARYVAQQMQRVELGEITYEDFTLLMRTFGKENG